MSDVAQVPDFETAVITTFPADKQHLINVFSKLTEDDGLTPEQAAEKLGLQYRIVPW